MVAHVTHPSQKRPYGAAMLSVLALVVVLANLAGGPVGGFITLLLGGAGVGAIVAAWMSMLAAVRARPSGQSRLAAFRSAELERWALEGLAVGSTIGFALAVLDAWVLA